ncbi:hypothetical protein Nepgr_010970 [Nepenthes gracilis]|uniref:C3H1-type domain-containing protein n=1 Tax=Nepenthes gracilis TaxID=150966 RepID=A0AAD3SE93_NEPGR|nr:hypothetical protein Nepgr_010970 [Nepenthes gracilis]
MALSMDFDGEPGCHGAYLVQAVPEINAGGDCYDNWATGVHDQAISATEDEHKNWNTGPSSETLSNSNYSSGLPAQSGIEQPNNKSRSSQSGESSNSRSKALGRMFFKTKLCCKFRAGVGRRITNCNFSHGMEELRRPPPIWQDVVAVNEEERGICDEQREELQIPTINSSDLHRESQRSYKGRHCKKFFTDKGCPYADSCTFLHDEQSRARESVTISVNITVGDGDGIIGAIQKPLNWKTRICNKWETTGNCPFGSKCHFAHGLTELHRYSGELLEVEGRDFSAPMESKQSGVTAKTDTVTTSALSAPCADLNHVGLAIPSQRLSSMTHPPKQRHLHQWKGPEKISRIYGDWIDDIK